MENAKVFKAKTISPGRASGPALITKDRIGLRGFINPERGTFTKAMRGLEGVSFSGAVLIFTRSKGSSGWSVIFDNACRHGNAPAAIINSKLDPFIVLACVLQDIPLVLIDNFTIFDQVQSGDRVTVDADRGEVILNIPV